MKYSGNALNEISFPLGGIGTGSIGLGGNGRFLDWEIFNRPNKGSINGYSHIAVKATSEGKSVCKVLNGDYTENLTGTHAGKIGHSGFGYGPSSQTMAGFPHFDTCEFCGEFPIASIDFSSEDFPGSVRLTAFNPFIPLDSENSSIPAAFFEVTFSNPTESPISYQAAFSLANPFEKSRDYEIKSGNISCVLLEHAEIFKEDPKFGQLCLACADADQVQPYWYRGGWQDSIVSFWNEFTSDSGLSHRIYDTTGSRDTCSIAKQLELLPGQTGSIRFVVTWNIPNRRHDWYAEEGTDTTTTWKNYYATVYPTAADSALYCINNWDMLYSRTCQYRDELMASTLDPAVLDAVSSTVSVLKSATVSRLENGEFYGFEGCQELEGSCEGTCQHVYNYAYALCFLFPDLERSIRNLEFDHCTCDNGATMFRIQLPLKEAATPWRSCLDGQMGCIFKTYREWKISGDNEWLQSVWPTVKKILAYAWNEENPDAWDRDKDGVLEGRQHHTLDMELFGPSSWLEGFYLAALRAGSEMAHFLGDKEAAAEYDSLFRRGSAWTKKNLFNGSYFIQKIALNDKSITDRFGCSDTYWNDETGEIKYQIGEGSEIDQLCGQWHANILGLGNLFDQTQIESALKNMVRNNYKPTLRGFTNPWRLFGLNDDAGTVICDYPEGTYKPKIPVPYCEETMHGFEYQFAGLLMSEGFIQEGLNVVQSVRNRYQGYNRNPWNEIECGSNYARSMASFAMLPILSGFTFDLPHGLIGFEPKVSKDHFRCLWSLGTGWGNVTIKDRTTRITILHGNLTLCALKLPYIEHPAKLLIDGNEVPFTVTDGVLNFRKQVITSTIEVL